MYTREIITTLSAINLAFTQKFPSALLFIIIGFILDLGWNGNIIDGIRVYSKSQYIGSFYIFIIISLIGVAVTFIGKEK